MTPAHVHPHLPPSRGWPAVLAGALLAACGGSAPEDRGDTAAALKHGVRASLEHCANGPLSAAVPCTGPAWTGGTLGPHRAHYAESQVVPYRIRFERLATGVPHVVRVAWGTRQLGRLGYDALGSFDGTEASADPCSGVPGCAGPPSTFAVPPDPAVAAGPDGLPGTADDVAQAPGALALFGGTIQAVGPYARGASWLWSETSLAITFTAAVPDPVLAFGGHVAFRRDWAPRPTLAGGAGGFYARVAELDGARGGAAPWLSAAAVHALPELRVVTRVVNDDGGAAAAGDFTVTVTGVPSVPASAPGAGAPGTVFYLAGPGPYAVSAAGPEGYATAADAGCRGALGFDERKACALVEDDVDRCGGVVCDPPAGPCQLAAACDPATGACRTAPAAEGTPCDGDGNACTIDACDGAGACVHRPGNAGAICRPAQGACDIPESCDGASWDCPGDLLAPANEVCREAAGPCDLPEKCSGTDAACPPDAKAAGRACRPAAGPCDVAEVCDGLLDACPSDRHLGASTVCRPAAGACDLSERCTGASAACPPDAKSTAVCRGLAWSCDERESCDGVSDDCPADAWAPRGQLCRASGGPCDPPEYCTGHGPACPSNLSKACTICGRTRYDRDASGTEDDGDEGVEGWRLDLAGPATATATSGAGGAFAFGGLAEGVYTVCQEAPEGTAWLQTLPGSPCWTVQVPSGEAEGCRIAFANACTGAGGARSVSGWCTDPGAHPDFDDSDEGQTACGRLAGLHLVGAGGADFDPASWEDFAAWAGAAAGAAEANLAYALSAQVSAVALNLGQGRHRVGDLVAAPSAACAGATGFCAIADLLAEADAELALHPWTPPGDPVRAYQAALAEALEEATEDRGFLQPGACPLTFAAAP